MYDSPFCSVWVGEQEGNVEQPENTQCNGNDQIYTEKDTTQKTTLLKIGLPKKSYRTVDVIRIVVDAS